MKSRSLKFTEDLLQYMRPTLLKSIGSLALIDPKQIGCGIFNQNGELIACDNVMRSGNLKGTCDTVRGYFGENLHAGDIVITNDPYSGGTRIQDLIGLAPVEVSMGSLAYLMISLPLPDLGGMALGGSYPKAQEIWAEGVRVTPVKLYRESVLQSDALTMLTLNSRLPHLVENDAKVLSSTLDSSSRKLSEFSKTHQTLFSDLETERARNRKLFKSQLETLPNGNFQGRSDPIHQCIGDGELFVQVDLSIKDSVIKLDFTGSSQQSLGFINSTATTTTSVSIGAIIQALGNTNNLISGVDKLVEIILPENCFLNARLPVSVGWSVYQPTRSIVQAIYAALDNAAFEHESTVPNLPEFPFRIKGCGESDCPFSFKDQ